MSFAREIVEGRAWFEETIRGGQVPVADYPDKARALEDAQLRCLVKNSGQIIGESNSLVWHALALILRQEFNRRGIPEV